jgi:hypothetical protein
MFQQMTTRDYAVLFSSLGAAMVFGAVVETASRMLPAWTAVWHAVRTTTGFTLIRLLGFGFALSRLNVASMFTQNNAMFYTSSKKV